MGNPLSREARIDNLPPVVQRVIDNAGLPDWPKEDFLSLLEAEADNHDAISSGKLYIPGLLQVTGTVEHYRRLHSDMPPEESDATAALRLARQDYALRQSGEHRYLVSESSLAMLPRRVRREQATVLVEALSRGQAIRILPEDVDMADENYSVFDHPDRGTSVYIEGATPELDGDGIVRGLSEVHEVFHPPNSAKALELGEFVTALWDQSAPRLETQNILTQYT